MVVFLPEIFLPYTPLNLEPLTICVTVTIVPLKSAAHGVNWISAARELETFGLPSEPSINVHLK